MARASDPFVKLVGGEDDLARMRRSLERASSGMKRRMARRLDVEVGKSPSAVRQGILNSRAVGPATTGLRRRIANTVVTVPGKGPIETVIGLDGSRMPAGERSLPAYHEGAKRRWRHPSRGNRDVWGSQRAAPSFNRTMRRERTRIDRAVLDEAERIANELDHGR